MGHQFTLSVAGRSGSQYSLNVFDLSTEFNAVGAVYAFLAVPSPRFVDASILYIGKANDLKRRLSEHQVDGGQWTKAQALGFNAIGALAVTTEVERTSVERDLITQHNPPLNTQLNALAQLADAMMPSTNALAFFPRGLGGKH